MFRRGIPVVIAAPVAVEGLLCSMRSMRTRKAKGKNTISAADDEAAYTGKRDYGPFWNRLMDEGDKYLAKLRKEAAKAKVGQRRGERKA